VRIRYPGFAVSPPTPAVAAALLGALLSAAPGTAGAEPVSVKYEVFFGGLHVLNAQANWEQGAAAYSIAAQA